MVQTSVDICNNVNLDPIICLRSGVRFYRKENTNDKRQINRSRPKNKNPTILSPVVRKPFFGVNDQDGIEAVYALKVTNKTLGIKVFVHEVTMQSINSRRMIENCNFK